MQYSNSVIGTWAVCRVASRVEAPWKRTYAIGTASLASSGKLLPSRACLKADGGLSHVPKVIKKGPRTCGRSVLGWNQEKHPWPSVYYRHLVSHLQTQHYSLLASDITLAYSVHIKIPIDTSSLLTAKLHSSPALRILARVAAMAQ
jgi:hypothetical protein